MTIVKKHVSIPPFMDVFLKENLISPSKLLQRAIKEEMDKQEKENQEGKK